jgi:hypothetical protein
MSDPLAGYFEKAPATVQPASDPLAGYFGSSTTLTEEPSDADLNTAVGREQARTSNLEQNIAKLRKIKPANEAHKVRIDRLIEAYQRQLPRGYGFIEGTSEPDRSTFENVVRGASAGAINEGLMGAANLATAIVAPAGKGPLAPLAGRIAEARQTVKEAFDPQGTAGSAAEIVGGLIGGTVPYGGAADIAATQVGRVIPAVGRVVEAAHSGGGVGTRIAANLAGGIPLNLLMAVGQPISGDPAQDLAARAKQFGIGTVADILFGMLPARGTKRVESKVSAEGPKQELSPERTQAFIETQAKRELREAAAAYEKDARTQARAEWQVANQGKKWTDLAKDDRVKLIGQWKEAHPKPVPVPPVVTPEVQAAVDAGPPQVNPAEVEATVAQVEKALVSKGATNGQATDAMSMLHQMFDTPEKIAQFKEIYLRQGGTVDLAHERQLATEAAATTRVQPPKTGDTSGSAQEAHSGVPEGTPSEIVAPGEVVSAIPEVVPGDDFDSIIADVQARGGLRDPEDLAAFNQELINLHERDLSPEEFHAEVDQLKEDFTPLAEPAATGDGPLSGRPEDQPARGATEPNVSGAEGAAGRSTAAGEGTSGAGETQRQWYIDQFGPLKYEALMVRWRKLSPTDQAKAWDFGGNDPADLPNATELPNDVSTALSYFESGIPKRTMQNLPKPHELSPEQAALAGGRSALQRGQFEVSSGTAQGTPLESQNATPRSEGLVVEETKRAQNATTTSVTRLETIDSKPLEELSARKLEGMTDKLLKDIDNADPGTPEYEAMHRDLEKLMAAERASEAPSEAVRAAQSELPAGAVVRPEPTDSNITGAARVSRIVEEAPPALDPKIARKLFTANLKRMAAGDLDAHIDDMQSRVSVLGKDEGAPYRERLDKALEERAERFQSQAGVRLQIPPAAGGFTAGFIGGYLSTDDQQDKLTNALMWGAIGAGAGYVGGRALRPVLDKPVVAVRSAEELPGGAWQEEIHSMLLRTMSEASCLSSFREKMRQRLFRGSL